MLYERGMMAVFSCLESDCDWFKFSFELPHIVDHMTSPTLGSADIRRRDGSHPPTEIHQMHQTTTARVRSFHLTTNGSINSKRKKRLMIILNIDIFVSFLFFLEAQL